MGQKRAESLGFLKYHGAACTRDFLFSAQSVTTTEHSKPSPLDSKSTVDTCPAPW
jgi:hypothetical protein